MKSTLYIKWTPIIALIPLAIYVLVTPYDPLANRIAVAITLMSTVGGFVGLDWWLARRTGIGLSAVCAWVLSVAAAEDAVGNFLYWYEGWHGYDDLGHVVGTFAVALLFLEILRAVNHKSGSRMTSFHLAVQAVAFAMFFAVVYELTELIGDAFFGTYRITARLDSALDLFWGLIGSIVAVIGWWVRNRHRPTV